MDVIENAIFRAHIHDIRKLMNALKRLHFSRTAAHFWYFPAHFDGTKGPLFHLGHPSLGFTSFPLSSAELMDGSCWKIKVLSACIVDARCIVVGAPSCWVTKLNFQKHPRALLESMRWWWWTLGKCSLYCVCTERPLSARCYLLYYIPRLQSRHITLWMDTIVRLVMACQGQGCSTFLSAGKSK
jgi:hypothetical protein